MPAFFSRNIHLARSFNNNFKDSSNASLSHSDGHLKTTYTGGSTSSTDSDSSTGRSGFVRSRRNDGLSSFVFDDSRNDNDVPFGSRVEPRGRPLTRPDSNVGPVIGNADDWGHFVDFRSPEITDIHRKSFIGDRRLSPVREWVVMSDCLDFQESKLKTHWFAMYWTSTCWSTYAGVIVEIHTSIFHRSNIVLNDQRVVGLSGQTSA